jgi:catechol 2,3-dioxygenase-like lactoylglutathione lyase family enzyme
MIGKGNIKVGLFLRPMAKPLPDIDSQFIIQHVAFLVDGDKFDALVAGLKAAGIQMDPVEDTGIAYSVFMHDPDNNLLEITTYHPVPSVTVQPASN